MADKKGNIYDRIFKENAETLFIPIIEQELGIEVESYSTLPEKFPKTVEREVDFLYDVVLKDGTEQLLHIEFQTENDKSMIYRMGFYHGLAWHKYRKPIRHIVIYLKKGKAKMRNILTEEEIFRGFDIINLHQLDTEYLIASQIPEVIMLGLLGNFKEEQTDRILRLIIERLKRFSSSKSTLSKYLTQLILLSRLRNLEDSTIKIVYDMPITYDVEKDGLYKMGEKKGEEKERMRQEVEKNKSILRLYNLGLDVQSIAEGMDISLEKVKQILEEDRG